MRGRPVPINAHAPGTGSGNPRNSPDPFLSPFLRAHSCRPHALGQRRWGLAMVTAAVTRAGGARQLFSARKSGKSLHFGACLAPERNRGPQFGTEKKRFN